MKKNEEIKLGEVLEELIKRFGISLTKACKGYRDCSLHFV